MEYNYNTNTNNNTNTNTSNNTDNNNRCILLDIEMPLDRICPASKKLKRRFCCYKDCGFSSVRDKNLIIKKRKVYQLELKNFII